MIDIIIPVYNTPIDDLERCLNSILNQSFTNYKVYIIDDGSNEEIKNYLDNYVKTHLNIIVKHIINSGVSNARNIGIDISNSEYITFVDADDTLNKDFLSEAFEIIKNNNLDVIIGGYNTIRDNEIAKTRLSESGLHIYEKETIINFLEKLLSSKTNDSNKEIGDAPVGRIYTRLFKRKSIGSLRFNSNIHMSEDTLFMIDYSYQAQRIGVIDKVWYNYYKNNYSITSATKREEMINNTMDFIHEIELRMNKEKNERLKKAYQARIDKASSYIDELRNSNGLR